MTDKRMAAKDKIDSNPLCSHVYGIINNDYNIKQVKDMMSPAAGISSYELLFIIKTVPRVLL